MITEIPKSEFHERIRRVQKELAKRGLDALLTFGSEAEPQYVRYLSDYWPAFETASVLVPVEGDPILIIGPETLTFATGRSKVDKIRQVLEYRESSEPEYPGARLDTFPGVLDEASAGRGIKKLGLAGYTVAVAPVYTALQQAAAGTQLVRADDILIEMRKIKSPNELELLRLAFRIAEKAMAAVFDSVKPGMTEAQVVGVAQEVIYREGAEYEGHPMYVLSGCNSTYAIGRPSHKKLVAGEVLQLDLGARVGGYASSVGRAICLGHMPDDVRRFLQVGLDAENATIELMHAGAHAGQIARRVQEFITGRGYGDAILYGPCHGIGLMECEHPWMETSSDYALQQDYTFQVDSFLHTREFGARFEDGVRVTQDGVEQLSTYRRELVVI